MVVERTSKIMSMSSLNKKDRSFPNVLIGNPFLALIFLSAFLFFSNTSFATPTITLNVSPSTNVMVGTAITLTVTVPAGVTLYPGACVGYWDTGFLGQTSNASNSYAFTWTPQVGTYTLHASGDFNIYASLTTPNVTITVFQPPPPTVTLGIPNSTYIVGQSIVMTANATPSLSADTITAVGFFNGSTAISGSTTNPYTYTWIPTSAGTYSITAQADDKVGQVAKSPVASITLTPHVPPTVSITMPTTSYIYPQNIPLTATASVTAGTINTNGIVFSYAPVVNNVIGSYSTIGTATLTSAASVTGSYTWTPPSAGSYVIKAVATDSTKAIGTSTINVTVTAHQPPVVTFTAPLNNSSSIYPSGIPLTANATVSAGTINTNGIVFSYAPVVNNVIGTYVAIGTATLTSAANVTGSSTWTPPKAGSYVIKAVATDNTTATGSSIINVTVTPHQLPVVSFTAPANNSNSIYPTAITLTANAVANGGVINANGVVFAYAPVVNNVVGSYSTICTPTIAAGANVNATCNWTPPTSPVSSNLTYSIKAAATDNAAASALSTIIVMVTPHQLPAVTFTAPLSGSSTVYPAPITLTANATANGGVINANGIAFSYALNGASTFTNIGSASFTSAANVTGTYAWTPPSIGSYVIKVVTTDSLSKTASATTNITVTAHQPPVVNETNNSSTTYSYPQNVPLTATATVSAGSINANGIVFTYAPVVNNVIGTYKTIGAATFSSGASVNGTYTWVSPAVGTYSVIATATDNTVKSTSSSPVTITVIPHVVPTVSFTSPVNYSGYYPTPIVLTANAIANGGTINANGIVFSYTPIVNGLYGSAVSIGAATVISGSNVNGSYSWNPPSAGTFLIKATATDSSKATSTASLTIVVNPPPPPSVSFTVPSNGEQYPTAPTNIVIYPNPAPSSISNAAITEVDYYLNGSSTPLAKVTSSPFSYNWNAPAGSYSLTANAIDANGAVGTSAPISVIVGSPTISVGITTPVANQSYTTAPSNIIITATAASSGSATISSVAFYNGETLLGTVKSSPYNFTWSNVGVGNYNLTAVATDSHGNNATSVIVPITVAATGASSAPTGLAVNLVGVLADKTNILNSAGGSNIGTENSGSLGTLLSATPTGVTVNDPTPCATGSSSCPPVSTSSSSYVQVHFFDTNKTGWVAQNSIVTLATTSTTIAAYAFITYNNPKLNLTPVVYQNLTAAQQTALSAAEKALIGKQQFFVFGGKVKFIYGNTNIQVVSNALDQVSMSDVSANDGTVLLANLSQLDMTSTCNPNGSWYNYIYCLLDNDAKSVAAAGGTFNLQTDPLMAQTPVGSSVSIPNYLNTIFASIGGVAKNFVITIDPAGQEVEIAPSSINSLGGSDSQRVISFYNDPLLYNKGFIESSFNQVKTGIYANNPTVSFFNIADNVNDVLSLSDLNLVVSSSASFQAAAKVQARIKAKDAGSTSQSDCHNSQIVNSTTGAILPCSNEIDFVSGTRWNYFQSTNFYQTGYPANYINAFEKLEQVGYHINVIRYNDSAFANDASGITFLQSLISAPGDILVLDFHGTADGIIGPIGCVDDTSAGQAGLMSSLNGLVNKGSIKKNSNLYWLVGAGCGFGKVGWGLNISNLNIGAKALEISTSCHGQATALKSAINFLGAPAQYESDTFIDVKDLSLISSYLIGWGPGSQSQYYNSYPPEFNNVADVNTNSITDVSLEAWIPLFNPGIVLSGSGGPIDSLLGGLYNPDCVINNLPGPKGTISNVPIPCLYTPYPGTSPTLPVHLYPYVTNLTFPAASSSSNGQILDVKFSDDVTTPNFALPISGHTPAYAGVSPVNNSSREFQVQLFPEVEALVPSNYLTYVNNKTDSTVPKMILSVTGANSLINGVAMIGNPKAVETMQDKNDTSGNPQYHLSWYPGATYFWNYNARFDLTSAALNNVFQATIPYRLHPYVDTVSASGSQVSINFSKPVQGTVGADASSYLAVDSSQCQQVPGQYLPSPTGVPYPSGQTPVFASPASGGGVSSIQIPLNSNITLASSSSAYLKITVQNVLSYPNKFPLLSDGSTFTYSGIGTTSSTGNANKFITTPGSYTITIPCTPQPNCTCAGKADGASDGCGGTCCVPPSFTTSAPYTCNEATGICYTPESHCGGTFADGANQSGGPTISYAPASNCSYQTAACGTNPNLNTCIANETSGTQTATKRWYCYAYGWDSNDPYSDPSHCPSPILDCKAKTS